MISHSVFLDKLKVFGSFVAFPHTIFALPFALSMLVILWDDYGIGILGLFWIVVALVTARSSAMAFNRIVDRDIDRINPRTQMRVLPAGQLSLWQAWVFLLLNSAVFLSAAAQLGRHCLVLAPLVLLVLFIYSYTKRFTAAAHFFLGLALACAPGGVWYAMTAEFAWEPVYFMVAVLAWVAGFDIIYSCQDLEFDKENKLHSIPSFLGLQTALLVAKFLHVCSVVLLFSFGVVMHLGNVYYLGVIVFAVILASQHRLVSPSDLSRVDVAFFSRNGLASVLFFLFVLLDARIF